MADVFGPFDGLPWAEAQWYRFARTWASDGILAVGDLPLTTSGLSVTVGTGRAWVGGAGFERTGTPVANTVVANSHATQFRRDRAVLRRSLASRTVTPVVLQGSPAASPVAPSIAQNEAGDWDLPLWSFLVPPASGTTISGLVDERRLITDIDLARLRLTAPGTSSSDVPTVGQVGTQVDNQLQRVAPTDLALNTANFENWGGFGDRELCYWREGRTVYLAGNLRLKTSTPSGTDRRIATLPAGFRPIGTVTNGSLTSARIQVRPNGEVWFENDTFGVTIQPDTLIPVNIVVPLG